MREKERSWIWVSGEVGDILGGVGAGETVIRIYCINFSIENQKKKEILLWFVDLGIGFVFN